MKPFVTFRSSACSRLIASIERNGDSLAHPEAADRIVAGSAVDFELAPDGRVVLVKVNGELPASRFERFRGAAGPGLSTDEIMALTRGD